MNINDIDKAIREVCPIDGISCGKLDDQTTWEVQFNPTTPPTQQQIDAANQILMSFVIDPNEPRVDPLQQKIDLLQAQLASLSIKVDVVEDKVDAKADGAAIELQ